MKGLISLLALVALFLLGLPFFVIGFVGRFVYSAMGVGMAAWDDLVKELGR